MYEGRYALNIYKCIAKDVNTLKHFINVEHRYSAMGKSKACETFPKSIIAAHSIPEDAPYSVLERIHLNRPS